MYKEYFNLKKYAKKTKDYKYNPWAICKSTTNEEEEPEKYERCVKKVKKQQL